MAARRSSFRGQHGNRRLTSWSSGPKSGTNGTPGTISGTGNTLGSVASSSLLDGLTLVRIRGEFMFHLVTADASLSGFHGAVGVCNVTDSAVAAGVASVPSLVTEEGWDGWIWHQYYTCIAADAIALSGTTTEPNQVYNVSAGVRYTVDSKAMRKTPADTTLVVVLESIEIGTSTAQWSFNCRVLDKLP